MLPSPRLLEIGYPYRGRVNGPRLGPETKRDGPFPAPQVIAQHTPANRSGKELDEWGDRAQILAYRAQYALLVTLSRGSRQCYA
jgi:hypothetical protein